MEFCITFRTHRAVVPVMTATRSRKIGPPHERLCPSVYSFFVTKARYSAFARHVKGAHTHVLTHTRVYRTELRNSEKSTRPKERNGGDDTFLRIERRRERDPGVSTIRNARLVPSLSLTTKRLLRRRDTNSLANSCLVSIVSPFIV
ncbi:hypothetical protein ALC60_04235 [Trachymyrmex zeteki]|uniref:Uncharacterized protein n=1 Tax=Mycetomoellerius zeteki TaxID=64791 RepID=A0A151X8D3_9HYME|nr:hypothetical protein ALC60_04235 [Trachymyrmex zeteki]